MVVFAVLFISVGPGLSPLVSAGVRISDHLGDRRVAGAHENLETHLERATEKS